MKSQHIQHTTPSVRYGSLRTQERGRWSRYHADPYRLLGSLRSWKIYPNCLLLVCVELELGLPVACICGYCRKTATPLLSVRSIRTRDRVPLVAQPASKSPATDAKHCTSTMYDRPAGERGYRRSVPFGERNHCHFKWRFEASG